MKSCIKKLAVSSGLIVTLASHAPAFAADFNIPFVNGAELGNMYSGWAVSANDASTQFTNPAGLVKLNHEQLVASAIGIMGSTQYLGQATIPIIPAAPTQFGAASSKYRGLIPLLYYAAPAYKNVVFAIGQTVPFALGTNYATDSIVRYTATRSTFAVVDLTPSVGIKINEKLAVGIGFDGARLALTLNHMYGPPFSIPNDSEGQNHLSSWGYGWHAGILYQPLPATRVGLSFNSMLMFHATGDSEVFGPTGEIRTTNLRSNVALPARAHLSFSQDINNRVTALATIAYTNWRTLKQLTLKNTMLPGGITTSVTQPFQYHNVFDYSAGVNFKANAKWLFRTGAMFFNAPSNDRDRSVADPSAGWVMLGIGAHYNQNKSLSYDVSYVRGIFQTAHVNATNALSSLAGSSSSNVNVFGAQLNWNMT
jgi:long-chain fatty acid transport protein